MVPLECEWIGENTEKHWVIPTLAKTKSNKQSNQSTQAIRKVVKSMLTKSAVEYKYFDQYSSSGLPAIGIIVNLSDVTRGTEVTQRVGNQILLKTFELRLFAQMNSSAVCQNVRAILLVDQMGVNAPAVNDVLDPVFTGSTYTPVAPYYWDYRKRFRVLSDKNLPLNKESNASAEYHVKHTLNVMSQHIGSSTTFKNQIYLLLISNETNIAQLPTFWYTSRLAFTDE